MPSKPPSDAIITRAAELRAGGATWEAVAQGVHRAVRTVYYWPRRYAERWTAALLQAERRLATQADCESVLTLRNLLASQDERVRWKAARHLIDRRLDRDKFELNPPSTACPPLCTEATRPITFPEG